MVVTVTDDEVYEYEHSIQHTIKLVWITLQGLIMTQFMVRGLIYYNRHQKGWSKVKTLLAFQGAQFIYLVVNEFCFHNITGVYLNLLFCAYGHFLSFCLVMDSCADQEHDRANSCRHYTHWIARSFFHILFLCLLGFCYFATSCVDHLYPPVFLCLGIFIFSQQIYDLFMHANGYLINWDALPPVHIDRLRFNKELFQKQMRILFYSNLFFGTFAMITIGMGFKFVNASVIDGDKQPHLACYEDNKWMENSFKGNIFMMCHQILILMQITASQMVLIRIPNNMGLFDKKSMFERVGNGLRTNLLRQSITSTINEHESKQDEAHNILKDTLVKLKAIKDKNDQATTHNNDIFRL